jgi:hypothetical protein
MVNNRNSGKESFSGNFERNIFYRKYNWLGEGYTMMESVITGLLYVAAIIGIYLTW